MESSDPEWEHENELYNQYDRVGRERPDAEHHPEIPQTAEEDHLLTGEELEELWAAEDKIRYGLQAFLEVAEALHTIRTKRLYREDYPNFGEYCREKWNLTDRHARNLANAWDIMLTIDPDPIGNPELLPQNERQARELKQVPHDRRAEVWETAVAEAGGVEHVCAHDVKTARERVMGVSNGSSGISGETTYGTSWTTEAGGQDFGRTEETPQRGVVVVDRDPANHAARLVNKYGADYCVDLVLALHDVLREKGPLHD